MIVIHIVYMYVLPVVIYLFTYIFILYIFMIYYDAQVVKKRVTVRRLLTDTSFIQSIKLCRLFTTGTTVL